MAKLNQILAVEKGAKSRTYANITELDRFMQKEALHSGITRTYRKKDDEGEDLPSEQTLVQMTTREMLDGVRRNLDEAWNVTATKEWANQKAVADIQVDGDTDPILKNVPVTYLLYLEKQLVDLRTLVGRLPILDPAEKWTWSADANAYVTDKHETHRTKKIPKVLVKYPATTEHPAQTEIITEDVIVGFWETVKSSGAMPAADRLVMLDRIDALIKAVKTARESANDLVVINQNAAAALLGYALGS